MTARIWTACIALALCAGIAAGWAARAVATYDRYTRSLIENHEASARYYNAQADRIINTNQTEKGATQHGK